MEIQVKDTYNKHRNIELEINPFASVNAPTPFGEAITKLDMTIVEAGKEKEKQLQTRFVYSSRSSMVSLFAAECTDTYLSATKHEYSANGLDDFQ